MDIINSAQINQIKTTFNQYIAAYLDGCTARISFEFGLQLGKERDRLTNDQYKKLADYLRAAMPDLRQQYLQRIELAFDELQHQATNQSSAPVQWYTAKLLDDEFVKEDYAVSQIIRHCDHNFLDELSQFNQLLATLLGKQVIPSKQNPVSPENLLRSLFEVFKPLKLKTEYRVALDNVFYSNVFSQLGFIYQELCNNYSPQLPSTAIPGPNNRGPEIKPEPVVNEPLPTNEDIEALQKKLQRWRNEHSPSDFDLLKDDGNSPYEQLELINGLQVLSYASTSHSKTELNLPIKLRLLSKLEALNFSGKVRQLGRLEEDIIDIVTLIFAHILQENTLPNPAIQAIIPLQMPMIAVALVQPTLLIQPQSPVRQLLDKLVATARFINEDSANGQAVIEQIKKVASKLTSDSGFELSEWIASERAFSVFLNAQEQLALRTISDDLQLKLQAVNPPTLNPEIDTIIVNTLHRHSSLPLFIHDFIQDAWAQVLLKTFVKKQELPHLWQKYLQTLDDLVFSVQPPENEQSRQRLLNLLPSLIKALRHGLKLIDYDKEDRSKFFKELAVLHVLALDKKESAAKASPPPVKSTTTVTADLQHCIETVQNLPENSWLSFNSDSGRHWAKLSSKDLDSQNVLFVDKLGEKFLECEIIDLARQLLSGQASVVAFNTQPITEYILENVLP
ncbi:MAG: DUF1631 family protein [Methylococcaceae bacterium]|nr:DUF1631 family protein [Methylococcaceae bacterium]